ncbi:flagellar hook assembly protein FlgD [Roseateles oligotrophus]|uniref:Basal-body rod modification protein FlgD n=1 Tax=Roseateles oligotrophus TaxID=1769250 RepID=A0ABT2YAP6_9BURK|nr:flagellar hook capping FlgD N-terminal domain-containing protein [Roseateles oligotrophus]MCV2367373.1 flagellar hook assembly protein FlgD [Roseateles oligotrophus]
MTVSSVTNTTITSPVEKTATKTAADTQDRFMKLLIAQMKNQDPMNPMDNAQVTSQMAQIQTVTGVSTLDTSIKSLSSQFVQMQALQSVSLVGRDVSVEGNRLDMENGIGTGVFELGSPADAVKLEVLSPGGNVIDTVQLGAQGSGRHNFEWSGDKSDPAAKYNFRITATQGTAAVASIPYSFDKVIAVNTSGSKLQLQLQNAGLVDYGSIKTID